MTVRSCLGWQDLLLRQRSHTRTLGRWKSPKTQADFTVYWVRYDEQSNKTSGGRILQGRPHARLPPPFPLLSIWVEDMRMGEEMCQTSPKKMSVFLSTEMFPFLCAAGLILCELTVATFKFPSSKRSRSASLLTWTRKEAAEFWIAMMHSKRPSGGRQTLLSGTVQTC